MGIFRKTAHPYFPWVCGMCVHEKVCIHFKKLQIHSKTRKVIFLSNFFQFGSGFPDPFEVFGINPDEHNMVFRRRGVVGYLNRVKNEWVESEQNIHFHLKMSCLRKNDATIEARYIATNDETFLWLDQQQME